MMFYKDADEIVEFARKGTLLQPQVDAGLHQSFGLRVNDLAEAERLASLPLQDESESNRLGLIYLPDRVEKESGDLHELGETTYMLSAYPRHANIETAIAYRIGFTNSDLANAVEGALCHIADARLARGRKIKFFEDYFSAFLAGFWPFALQQVNGEEKFAVYTGGVKLDNEALILPY